MGLSLIKIESFNPNLCKVIITENVEFNPNHSHSWIKNNVEAPAAAAWSSPAAAAAAPAPVTNGDMHAPAPVENGESSEDDQPEMKDQTTVIRR